MARANLILGAACVGSGLLVGAALVLTLSRGDGSNTADDSRPRLAADEVHNRYNPSTMSRNRNRDSSPDRLEDTLALAESGDDEADHQVAPLQHQEDPRADDDSLSLTRALSEPRDSAWATEAEESFGDYFSDLASEFEEHNGIALDIGPVECRTNNCTTTISWDAPQKKLIDEHPASYVFRRPFPRNCGFETYEARVDRRNRRTMDVRLDCSALRSGAVDSHVGHRREENPA